MKVHIIKVQDSRITPHSWRIGTATKLSIRGISDSIIFAHVGWSPYYNSGKKYIRPSEYTLSTLMQIMVNAPIKLIGLRLE